MLMIGHVDSSNSVCWGTLLEMVPREAQRHAQCEALGVVVPTKTTCTEANLPNSLISKALLENRYHEGFYAAVAANISIRRALVTMVRIRENVIVNRAMVTNRMIMRSTKFRAMIDVIGRAEDIMVLMTSAMRSSLLSLYRIIELLPAASPGVSFCRG